MAIYNFFVDKGYNVEITYNDADAEFIFMQSKIFYKSNEGVSKLIDKIRSLSNKLIINE